jgi:hypothetical protein
LTNPRAIICLCVAFSVVTAVSQQPVHRVLWIAKFTCETKAASAVASTQVGVNNALKFSNIFDSVETYESNQKQPEGAWVLTANETDYRGGNAAARALIGYGAGRAQIEIEYKLIDPTGKVVFTQRIRTKPPWSWGGLGANQDQGIAANEQAQKITDVLAKFFGATQEKR